MYFLNLRRVSVYVGLSEPSFLHSVCAHLQHPQRPCSSDNFVSPHPPIVLPHATISSTNSSVSSLGLSSSCSVYCHHTVRRLVTLSNKRSLLHSVMLTVSVLCTGLIHSTGVSVSRVWFFWRSHLPSSYSAAAILLGGKYPP